MKFLLDECVEGRLLPYLRQLGHDVSIVGVDYPKGLSDLEVLSLANREDRILITNDHGDFGELIFRSHLPHCGVILFRLRSGDVAARKAALHQIIAMYADQLHSFIVVTPQKIRIRKTSPPNV